MHIALTTTMTFVDARSEQEQGTRHAVTRYASVGCILHVPVLVKSTPLTSRAP